MSDTHTTHTTQATAPAGALQQCSVNIAAAMRPTGEAYGFDPGTLLTVILPILVDILGNCLKSRDPATVAGVLQGNRLLADVVCAQAVRRAVREHELELSAAAQKQIAGELVTFARTSADFVPALQEINTARDSFLQAW